MSETSVFSRFRTAFFTGLVLLAPLVVTVWVFTWLVSQVGGSFRNVFFPVLPEDLRRFSLLLDLMATAMVVVLIAALGLLSQWVLGRYFGGVAERFIQGIPGIGGLYAMIKQIVQTFSGENRAAFSKVVLVEFPHPGSRTIGFLTNDTGGEAAARTGEDLVSVFVPTAPNPTSGFLLMVPRTHALELGMSVRDGMKFVLSGGSVLPRWPETPASGTTRPGRDAGGPPDA